MDFSDPFRTVTPTLDGPVLRVLAKTSQPMTRSQVAELIGDASEAGVRKVLHRLAEQGTVIEQRIGKQYTYAANREHITWPAIDLIVRTADRLDAKIREHVESWTIPALSVELFGSVATGTATAASDVDLMVYRPHLDEGEIESWDEQIAGLVSAVERWTGNTCEILEIDPPTLIEMAAHDEPVLHDARVPISGINISAASPPRIELAKTIQTAMSSSQAARELRAVSRKLDSRISPEFDRTIRELKKVAATASVVQSVSRQQGALTAAVKNSRANDTQTH